MAKYKSGESGNPKGRPAGSVSPKTVAMNIIFKVMEKYQDKFNKVMIEEAEKNIKKFYTDYVNPLQPKNSSVEIDDKRKVTKDEAIGAIETLKKLGGGKSKPS